MLEGVYKYYFKLSFFFDSFRRVSIRFMKNSKMARNSINFSIWKTNAVKWWECLTPHLDNWQGITHTTYFSLRKRSTEENLKKNDVEIINGTEIKAIRPRFSFHVAWMGNIFFKLQSEGKNDGTSRGSLLGRAPMSIYRDLAYIARLLRSMHNFRSMDREMTRASDKKSAYCDYLFVSELSIYDSNQRRNYEHRNCLLSTRRWMLCEAWEARFLKTQVYMAVSEDLRAAKDSLMELLDEATSSLSELLTSISFLSQVEMSTCKSSSTWQNKSNFPPSSAFTTSVEAFFRIIGAAWNNYYYHLHIESFWLDGRNFMLTRS